MFLPGCGNSPAGQWLIQSRLFREGSIVRAGDVLYQIAPTPYKAAYEQAKAALATTEAELTTAKANLPAIRADVRGSSRKPIPY